MTFSDEPRIFRNEDMLSPEYLPDILPHREQQIKYLADSLMPLSNGRKPQNIFIFGPPGIGKTASARYVFREFEEFSGVKTIYINCWDYNTSTAVLAKIVSEFGMFVQRRGWAKDEIISRLIEALEKSKKSLLICLDEVDQLIHKDQRTLYDLLRLNQYVKNPIGLIFISNDPHVFSGIEARISSSLSVDEIEFKPYTIKEMMDILKERASYGFLAVEDGVVALASARAISKGGDVRVGLECLRKAGRHAESNNGTRVRVEDAKKVLRDVKDAKPQIVGEKVSDMEKTISKIVNDRGKLTFNDLYAEYKKSSDRPLTKRMFREYVNHLEEVKLIKIGKRKLGRSRLILKV